MRLGGLGLLTAVSALAYLLVLTAETGFFTPSMENWGWPCFISPEAWSKLLISSSALMIAPFRPATTLPLPQASL